MLKEKLELWCVSCKTSHTDNFIPGTCLTNYRIARVTTNGDLSTVKVLHAGATEKFWDTICQIRGKSLP